jgi:hypothetical protein
MMNMETIAVVVFLSGTLVAAFVLVSLGLRSESWPRVFGCTH